MGMRARLGPRLLPLGDPVHALVRPVAVRTAGLGGLAATGWLLSGLVAPPDANIGLGIALLGSLVLAVVAWGAVDGVRSVRRGRPDREGLLVWLLSAAAFGLLISLVTGVGVAVSEGGVPVGPLLSAAFTWAGFVAVPGAVSYGLARTVAEGRGRRPRAPGPVSTHPEG